MSDGKHDPIETLVVEYVAHQSWRCEHPPHFYLASGPPTGDCPCGLIAALRDAGIDPEPWIPRVKEQSRMSRQEHTGTPWACDNCGDVCNVVVGETCCDRPTPTLGPAAGWRQIEPAVWLKDDDE